MHVTYGTPATEPITTAELKTHLRIDTSDEDTLLATYISAARAYAERELGMTIAESTHTLYLDEFPSGNGVIELLRPPVTALNSVKYYDIDNVQQTWSSNEYEVDFKSYPSRLRPATDYFYPSTYNRLNAVEITYTAGYDEAELETSEWAKHLIKIIAGFMYEHREAYEVTGMRNLPMAVENIINNHRVYEVA